MSRLVLFVGSVFNRRHLPDLIRAFKPIATRHPGARLEIVGDNRTYPHEDLPAIAAAEGIASRVSIRPYVSDADLAELYGRARAFSLLSEYEGFGHPPLEALGSGVPSVLLDTDVAREVCGDAALYVARGDIAGTTAALNSLLFDEDVRQRVLEAGACGARALLVDARRRRDTGGARGGGMNALAIVIVSYNTRSELENCLQSLHDHPPHVSHEIVVVDNASRDGSVEAVRARWPGVRVITLNSNVGFSSANNAGIRSTESELLLLLNSDTIVSDGAIDRLIAAMRELPGASVVGPRIVDANGQAELSHGRMMTPLAELRQKLLVRHASRLTLSRLTSKTRQVDWVTAACLLVRRRDAEAAGLLDERYFMYCEDVDFCAAVRANGGKIYFTPRAEIVHLRGRSWRAGPGATARELPPQSPGLLSKAPPLVGAAPENLSGPSGKAAGVSSR